MRTLLALLLFAGPLLGQAANGWAPIENGWGEVQIPSSTSAPSGLTSGRVTLSTGATTVGDDAGLTRTGTGDTFHLKLGSLADVGLAWVAAGTLRLSDGSTGYGDLQLGALKARTSGSFRFIADAPNNTVSMASDTKLQFSSTTGAQGSPDLALSRVSAGTLLVEDGAGNARDVQARTVLAGDGATATPSLTFSAHTSTGFHVGVSNELAFDTGGSRRAYIDVGATGFHFDVPIEFSGFGTYLSSNATPRLSVGSTSTAGSEGGDIGARTGYFGTSLYAPLLSTAPDATGTNTAGTNLTIQPQAGTGSATGSSIVFQTPTAGASGTTAQTQTTRLTITEGQVLHEDGTAAKPAISFASGPTTGFNTISSGTYLEAALGGVSSTYWSSSGFNLRAGLAVKFDGSASQMTGATVRLAAYTVATLPAGTVGDTAYVTDATAPTYLGALTGGGAVTTPVFYNGAAWVSH